MTKGQPFAKASELVQYSRRGVQSKRTLDLLLKSKNRLLIAKAGHKSTKKLRRVVHFIYCKANTVGKYIRIVRTLTAAGGIIKKMVTVTEEQGTLGSPHQASTFSVQTPGSFMIEMYNKNNSCDAIVPSFEQNQLDGHSSHDEVSDTNEEARVVQAHTPGSVIIDMALQLKQILTNRARMIVLQLMARLVRLHREMKGRQLLDVEVGGKISVFWGFLKIVARIRVLSEWLNINQGFGLTVSVGELDEEKQEQERAIEIPEEEQTEIIVVSEPPSEVAETTPLTIELRGTEGRLLEEHGESDHDSSVELAQNINIVYPPDADDNDSEDKENTEKISFLTPSAYNLMINGKSAGSAILQENHRSRHVNTSWNDAKEKLIKTPLSGLRVAPHVDN